MNLVICRATMADQQAVEALSQTDKAVKEFKYLWRLYRNWGQERSLPIIAVDHDLPVENFELLVGFHAASFGRVYVNSYYQLTAPSVRGMGVGGLMVAFLITEAHRLNCTRLKFKVPHGSAGQAFWEGFGLRPFGRDAHHYLFDVSLYGVHAPVDLAIADHTVPERELNRYTLRGGVEILL